MKIEFDGNFSGLFWVRNLLRAALLFMWFDYGRYIGRFGDQPIVGIELMVIISIIVVIVLEVMGHRSSGGDNG